MSFKIIREDITRVKADAIVNTANPAPICGSGTDYAIYQAAGYEQLLEARKKIGAIPPGEAAVTDAFSLQAKYIIHTVGPVWMDGEHGEFDILKNCYAKPLKLAVELGCRSIAFPLIATGVYGFPKEKGLQVAMSVIEPFLMEYDMTVILVVFDRESFAISGRVVDNIRAYVDANYVMAASTREYVMGRDRRNRIPESVDACMKDAGPEDSHEEDVCIEDAGPENRHKEDVCIEDSAIELPPMECAPMECSPMECIDLEDGCQEIFEEERDGQIRGNNLSERASLLSAIPILGKPARKKAEAERELHKSPRKADKLIREERKSGAGRIGKASAPKAVEKARASKHVNIEDLLEQQEATFQEKLFEIIDERGLSGPQVYKNYISKQLYSKIQADPNYHPNKFTALALCLSLHLDLEETQDLLSRAGWTLSPSSKADLVVKGCIINHEYNLVKINIMLFEFDCPELEKIR